MTEKEKDLVRRTMIANALVTVAKVKGTSDSLTFHIKAMCGWLMSKTGMDDVSFTDDTDTVFMDPRSSAIDTSTIESIQYNEAGELVVYDDGDNEPTDLSDLMIECRMALAEKLAQMLNT